MNNKIPFQKGLDNEYAVFNTKQCVQHFPQHCTNTSHPRTASNFKLIKTQGVLCAKFLISANRAHAHTHTLCNVIF